MAENLLSITQEILSAMTSDNVNSITDTEESEAVARIVLSTYRAMTSNRTWKHFNRLLKLNSPSDTAQPTHLSVEDKVKELTLINYNKAKLGETRLRYEEIIWQEPDSFLRYTNQRNNEDSNIVIVTDPTGVKLLIRTDVHPTRYTSFDDKNIVMDSYDIGIDDTLHPDNVQAYGNIMPTTSLVDGWEPDLPEEAIAGLVEEARSKAQFNINSTRDIKAEQESGRQQRWLSRKNWTISGGIKYPNYGRRSAKFSREPTFERNR